MDIQELIRVHRQVWQNQGNFVPPSLADCLDFLISEAAEAIDARLRLQGSKYARGIAKETTPSDIAEELIDVIIMATTALDLLGIDLQSTLNTKLEVLGDRFLSEGE